jgi:hypothetical protein
MTGDDLVNLARKKGSDKVMQKLVSFANSHEKLRKSYSGEMSYKTENLDYAIQKRVEDIHRLLSEIGPREPEPKNKVQQATEILADWEKALSPQHRAKIEGRIKRRIEGRVERRVKG